MYKKAIQMKLRFPSQRGLLTVEQVYDLKLSQLEPMIKGALAEVKSKTGDADSELSFLEGKTETKEVEEIKLRFDILKDIYLTKQAEIKAEREEVNTNEEIKKLEAALARKKDKELEEMSADDLEKKILELKNKNK